MVIKFRGYLGDHYLNIGTTKVTRIIGVIGQNRTSFGIKATCWASKKGIMFLCPIHISKINSECHCPGRRSWRPFRMGRTCSFDYRQPQYMHPIFPIHVCFQVFKVQNLTYFYSISVISTIPRPCLLSGHVAYFFCPVAPPTLLIGKAHNN